MCRARRLCWCGVTALHDIRMWARGSGLEIVLLIVGAILLTRFLAWLGDKITRRIDAHAQETDALVRSEAAKHRHALAQVITWVSVVVIYCVTAILVAQRLRIPLTSLFAPAAVAAVALGCGAQRIVQDLLAGCFIITERQDGEEAYAEPEMRQLLLDPPAVMGVQSIDVTQFQVRMVARTLPGMQFDVGRMLRARVAAGLLKEGISLPASVETIEPNGAG